MNWRHGQSIINITVTILILNMHVRVLSQVVQNVDMQDFGQFCTVLQNSELYNKNMIGY